MEPPEPGPHRRIRLILVENQALLRSSLARLFTLEADFDVAGECSSAAEALALLERQAIDVILLDFDLGVEHGNALIAAALSAGYSGKFLVVTDAAHACDYAQALKLGASGIFLKSGAVPRLVHAVRTVALGEVWIDPDVIRLLAQRVPADRESPPAFTEREQKVLEGIVGGLSNRRIGDNIGLTEGSVKAVVQQLFEKTGVRTRSQLVRIAMEQPLVLASHG